MAVCLLPAPGLAAFLARALSRHVAESWEVRLSEIGRAGFHREATARDFPEVRGVVGYAAQFLRPEDWALFEGEAFAPARVWRLLPRAIETVSVASALLVGMQTGTLYAVQPFDEDVIIQAAQSGGAGVDLSVTLHLDLTGAELDI